MCALPLLLFSFLPSALRNYCGTSAAAKRAVLQSTLARRPRPPTQYLLFAVGLDDGPPFFPSWVQMRGSISHETLYHM